MQDSPVKMVGTLLVITILAGAALAGGNMATRDKIAEARKQVRARAVRKIFPACRKPSESSMKVAGQDIWVYRCPGGNVAFTFSTKMDKSISSPYGGEIKIMVGVGPSGTVKGVQVVSHSETPGLGANITNPKFLNQFKGLNLKSGKWAVKKDDPAGLIDGISGATISSRAMTTMVKAALEFFNRRLSKGHRPRLPGGMKARDGRTVPRSRAIRRYSPPRHVPGAKPNTRGVMIPDYIRRRVHNPQIDRIGQKAREDMRRRMNSGGKELPSKPSDADLTPPPVR